MYKILTRAVEIEDMVSKLMGAEAIAFDIETTALSHRHGDIRLLQFSDGAEVYIIDAFKLENPGALKLLKPLLESPRPRKVIQNSMFETSWIKNKLGMSINGIFDTMLAGRMIDHRDNAGLAQLLERYLKVKISKDEQKSNWARPELTESQLEYAALDVIYLPRLRKILIERLIKDEMTEIAHMEFQCVPVISRMEDNGFPIDREMYERLCDNLEFLMKEKAEELRNYLNEGRIIQFQMGLFGEDTELNRINLNSPVQLKNAFKNKGIMLNATNDRIIKENLDKYPDLMFLSDYRSIAKSVAAFGRKIFDYIDPVTGRIHASFHLLGAGTGRFSSSRPNLQQQPADKIFRECYRPEKGKVFCIFDYSQIELRILAFYSKDKQMTHAYREGLDLHSLTAQQVFNLPCKLEDVKKMYAEKRTYGKQLNFGVVYGIGAESFSIRSGMTIPDAQKAIKGFYSTYSGANNWLKERERQALRDRYVRTAAGRKFKLFFDPEDHKAVGLAKRNARNSPIQGLSADILKTALIEIDKHLDAYDAKLVNIVHDEVIIESPKECALELSEIVKREMELAGEKYVTTLPIVAEFAVGESWASK